MLIRDGSQLTITDCGLIEGAEKVPDGPQIGVTKNQANVIASIAADGEVQVQKLREDGTVEEGSEAKLRPDAGLTETKNKSTPRGSTAYAESRFPFQTEKRFKSKSKYCETDEGPMSAGEKAAKLSGSSNTGDPAVGDQIKSGLTTSVISAHAEAPNQSGVARNDFVRAQHTRNSTAPIVDYKRSAAELSRQDGTDAGKSAEK